MSWAASSSYSESRRCSSRTPLRHNLSATRPRFFNSTIRCCRGLAAIPSILGEFTGIERRVPLAEPASLQWGSLLDQTGETRHMKSVTAATARSRGWVLVVLVAALLGGLPVAVWLDLQDIAENALSTQAGDLNSLITSVRGYYATNVVGRVLASPGTTQVVHNYMDVPGAIPIPATLSLELGSVISTQQSNISYRFVSDFPFKGRTAHAMDDFERNALASLRQNPNQRITEVAASLFSDRVRLVAPIVM